VKFVGDQLCRCLTVQYSHCTSLVSLNDLSTKRNLVFDVNSRHEIWRGRGKFDNFYCIGL
jgi:hypothetical protein